jgi:hypothetical protein
MIPEFFRDMVKRPALEKKGGIIPSWEEHFVRSSSIEVGSFHETQEFLEFLRAY